MQIFTPTEEEKVAMKALGEDDPLERYAYCKGCIQIMKNPTTGLAFMRGILKHHAKSAGAHPDLADKAIDRFTVKLLDRSKKRN